MNSIASIATVATDPCASRDATMPAAISICERTQPPKIWPLALMSPGPGTTRRIGSPLASLVVMTLAAIRLGERLGFARPTASATATTAAPASASVARPG